MRNAASLHLNKIAELRRAVAEHQFVVLYQPIVELHGNAIVGAEAQVRWDHPVSGRLPARDFVALAEEAGLAGQIDEWVLSDALARAREWQSMRGTDLFVSINKSSLGLSGKAAERHWQAIIGGARQAPVPVALEISEAMLSSDAPGTSDALHQLADSGVRLYLDNFGSGAASITSLTRLPLVGLKIAPLLVHGLQNPPQLDMAKAIIATGHALGLKVIAEGVETEQQKSQLTELGCDYAQGFLFSDAMAADAMAALLTPAPRVLPH
jgi:EAL domain-containing protein (putative c-di-GMP-specific phosphodiesterase class I)